MLRKLTGPRPAAAFLSTRAAAEPLSTRRSVGERKCFYFKEATICVRRVTPGPRNDYSDATADMNIHTPTNDQTQTLRPGQSMIVDRFELFVYSILEPGEDSIATVRVEVRILR